VATTATPVAVIFMELMFFGNVTVPCPLLKKLVNRTTIRRLTCFKYLIALRNLIKAEHPFYVGVDQTLKQFRRGLCKKYFYAFRLL
jgi:hypothetical protein